MEPVVPPVDVDMAPDEPLSQPTPLETDLTMEDDLVAAVPVAGLVDEDGGMAVSDEEHEELVMEDLAAVDEEPSAAASATDGEETVMHLEGEGDATGVEDVSFEVEDVVRETDATPEVEVLSQPSPATAAPQSPPPPTGVEVVEVSEASATSTVERTLAAPELPSMSPKTESLVHVEAPSDVEEDGVAATAEDATDDTVEPEGGQNVEGHASGDELDHHHSESGDHEHDHENEHDSSSIASSEADPNAETALFSITERSSQMPVTISYQRINVDVDTEALQTDTCALFQPSDLPSSSTAPPLKVILESQQSLFDAPLIDLFDALREEAAFASEPGLLDIEDEEGTREWVLEHLNEAVCLCIGEDNISARDFSLADLAHVHELCELPEPLQLRLKPGNIRFKQRIEMIKGMRDVMDGEESAVDVDEMQGRTAELQDEEVEDLAEMAHEGEHETSFSDDGYVDSGDEEEEEVTVRPDYEQGDLEVEELDAGSEDDEITDNVQPVVGAEIADQVDKLTAPEELSVAVTDDREDYPNGPDDPDLVDQTNDAPAREVEAEAAAAEDVTEFALEPTADETSIVSDSKIVETANGDIEVPAAARHIETAFGSFDEEEATRQAGAEDVAVLTADESSAPEAAETVSEAAELAREVEQQAAADSTAGGGLVEPVPIPEQFLHEAADDPDAVLVMEEAQAEKDFGAQSDSSSAAQAIKRKRPELEASEARGSARSASVAAAASGKTKTAALARTAEEELYGDSPAPTPAPSTMAQVETTDVIELGGDSDDEQEHSSDNTLADSDLIVIGEDEDQAAAGDADDAGDDEDRDAKRPRTD